MSDEFNPFNALSKESAAIETVIRAQSVKRWHMVDTTRSQTLAEHSTNVALLVFLVCRSSPINYFDDSRVAAVAALTHDLAEVFTGDVPTHTKGWLMGLDELEDKLAAKEFKIAVNHHTQALIKLCDLADGIRFIRVHGVGSTAKHAENGLTLRFDQKLASVVESLSWPPHLVLCVSNILMSYIHG